MTLTHISEIMSWELLQQEVAAGYIRCRPHPELDLLILNYSEKVLFEKRWNNATVQCRGLIVNGDWEIVARPWEKFWNFGEKPVLIASNDPVEITDKADGSLGIGYPTPDGWGIATRGSFESDQAKWATEWLYTRQDWLCPDSSSGGFTPLFEIVGNWNRIVLDYGDFEGLILLGCVDTQMGYVYGPREAAGLLGWPGKVTKVFPEKTMAEFISGPNSNRPNAEGVVVRSGWRMVKIKQDDYVKAHAIVTGLSNRGVWEALAAGHGIPEQAAFMPDEFYAWLVHTAAELQADYTHWKNAAIMYYREVRERLVEDPTRKQFAGWALGAGEFRAAMFKLFDGQPINDLAWKAVKPERFERPFSQSQDNS